MRATIDGIIQEIRSVRTSLPFFVAFSGGMDSTVAARLVIEAVGKAQVELVHVTFEEYAYARTLENVKTLADNLGCQLRWVKGKAQQEKVLRYGPSCNLCTKRVKLGGVRSITPPGAMIVSGANQSDSWGQYGEKLLHDTYSPLFDFDKPMIKELLTLFGFKMEQVRSGESIHREGCKLKHLMKMLAVPSFHGKAVSEANENLLDILHQSGWSGELANVKIIGPLRKNVGLINVHPLPDDSVQHAISERLKALDSIHELHWMTRPAELDIIANPSIIRTPGAMHWLSVGKFSREFAVPVTCRWRESKNNKLHTYHVVDAHW